MKKIYTLLALAITLIASAQAPQGFNYQATVRNSSGALIVNQNVYFKFKIIQNSQIESPIYTETHSVLTDDLGQVNLTIGQGTATNGTFSTINWGIGNCYLGIELNTGNGFTDMGITQFLSVPYALYAYKSHETISLQAQITALQNTVNSFYPSLTTTNTSLISEDSAFTGVSVSSTGASEPNSGTGNSGVVWSTSPNPIISYETKIELGFLSIGENPVTLNNLTPNTKYYARAFATNAFGTSYGNEISFTTLNVPNVVPGNGVNDVEGNKYNSVIIETQEWTKENLNVTKYRDGTLIPEVTDPEVWRNLTTGAWCYYSNSSINGTIYGKLYNWYAIMGIHNEASLTDISLRKQLAPLGYHIPTESEWNTLINFLGGKNVAGGKMKEIGTTHWSIPNIDASNSKGFSALPGGHRNFDGLFYSIGNLSNFFYYNSIFVNIQLSNDDGIVRSWGAVENSYKTIGCSVRCVKD